MWKTTNLNLFWNFFFSRLLFFCLLEVSHTPLLHWVALLPRAAALDYMKLSKWSKHLTYLLDLSLWNYPIFPRKPSELVCWHAKLPLLSQIRVPSDDSFRTKTVVKYILQINLIRTIDFGNVESHTSLQRKN